MAKVLLPGEPRIVGKLADLENCGPALAFPKPTDLPTKPHDAPPKKSGLGESSGASFRTAVLTIFQLQRAPSCQGFSARLARQFWNSESERWPDETPAVFPAYIRH